MGEDAFNEETSPKATRLVANLAKSPGPALIYSQFVDVGGLAVIARFLRKAGYTELVPPPATPSGSGAAKKGGGRFAHGDPPSHVRGDRAAEPAAERKGPGGGALLEEVLALVPAGRRLPAETAAIRAIVGRGALPVSPWVDEAPSAPPGVEYATGRGVRYDALTNLHREQRKLSVSEVLAYTELFESADDWVTVVYAGAASGHHLPYLARLFPKTQFHLYDPAPFRFKAEASLRPRLKTYSEYFTDEVARSWAGKCDVFVCDIRLSQEDRDKFEDQVAGDMAAQDRWARLISPRLGAVLKFLPPYIYGPEQAATFEYIRGRVMWQAWPPRMSTEGRLIVRAADATPEAPPMLYNARVHQTELYYHNNLVRPWQEFVPPVEGLEEAVPGYDGCFDCALEAWAWRAYCELPGRVSKGVAQLMNGLTKALGQSLVSKRTPPYHGVSPREGLVARMKVALRGVAPRRGGGSSRYAIISGDVKPDDRIRIQEVFNSPQNAHGELIRALLVSKTGAEGLDLKGVRQVHIFEPYWDKSREDQVKARGVRLGSHDHLPVEEREVQPFLYIAVANREMFEGMRPSEREKEAPPSRYRLIEEITIDEKFHTRALAKQVINGSFRELLRDVCLECSINGYGDCRLCVPTDAPLFHEDPIRDLRLPDPCQTLTESELSVKEISLPAEDGDGATYFYSEDPTAPFGVRFFVYDEGLEAHTPVDPSTGLFMRLLEVLRG
jgi:hypothetical protein